VAGGVYHSLSQTFLVITIRIRLGPGQHTQYSLMPISQLAQTIIYVALGQDHTLALTKSGDVLSWGLNRFSQLGYVIEPSSTGTGVSLGRSEEHIQASPRKIFGPLKKEVVRGVAACKTASACWTDDEVFTWGTNHGQLGKRTFLNAIWVGRYDTWNRI
jgi:alpha-tubulin suppressor-like RCC1 family protein